VTAGFDVIIVGGGPAGATAARGLARGGARVLVLDRARFPRDKPCGGGLTRRALKRFPDVDAALPRISTHLIRRLYMEAPGGVSVSIETAEPTVLLVRRTEFDNLLMTMAQEAGAELAEGADVTRAAESASGVRLEARDGRVFEAPIAVAADGVYSTVARRLGFNPGWPRDCVAIDMMEETPSSRLRAVDEETLWVSFAPGSGHGYGYIFPKRDYVNVGVGYVVTSFRASIREAPHALHSAFVESLKARGLLEGETDRSRFTPYQLPVGGPLRTTARGRVYLAGDAGGFVNGFSAEGIYFAMVTGDLAARAILAGPSPRLYERLWRREIGTELRDSRLLSRYVFADLSRVGRLVRALRTYPPVAGLLVDYATGKDTYEGVRRRFVLKFPRIAATLAVHLISRRRQVPRRAPSV
jgi:geranylgeranyl reductase family protein